MDDEDLEEIKSIIDPQAEYTITRSSGGLNTKIGYMYTYKLMIGDV